MVTVLPGYPAASQASLLGLSGHPLSLLAGGKPLPSDLHHRPPHHMLEDKRLEHQSPTIEERVSTMHTMLWLEQQSPTIEERVSTKHTMLWLEHQSPTIEERVSTKHTMEEHQSPTIEERVSTMIMVLMHLFSYV